MPVDAPDQRGTALIAALVMSLLGKAGVYVMDIAMHRSPPGSIYI